MGLSHIAVSSCILMTSHSDEGVKQVILDNNKLEKNKQIRQNESMYTISDLRKLI